MGTFGRPPDATAPRDLALLLIAAFGLAASITFLWLGMRAVMDIGGVCADGGPFVPRQSCPDGVPLVMTLGMFGIFGFGGLGFFAGAAVGGPWVSLPLLAWPGVFLSLGWNFLEYAFVFEEEAGGPIWGWLIPGVMFVLMGAVPLWIAWSARSSTVPLNARFGMPSPEPRGFEPAPSLGWDPSHRRVPSSVPVPKPRPVAAEVPGGAEGEADGDVVTRLERLSALRRRGDLTNGEFERFKAALLRSVEGAS
jgi:hypothetical protein